MIGPDRALEIFRECITESEVSALARDVIGEALDGNQRAREFLAALLFPKDTSKAEDRRYKRFVVCTFEQYNDIEQMRAKIAKLERENSLLRSGLSGED